MDKIKLWINDKNPIFLYYGKKIKIMIYPDFSIGYIKPFCYVKPMEHMYNLGFITITIGV